MLLLLLGILGILQSTFLPGALITLWCVREEKLSLFFPISFGLSLLTNYLLITLLVMTKLYNQQIMILVIFVEFILFLLSYRLGCLTFFSIYKQKIKYYFIHYKELFALKYIPYFIVSVIFLLSCYSMFNYSGNVFTGWDAVNSWNKWAVDWSKCHLAKHTWNYPQMVPILQSICYVLTGRTDIEFFSYIINLFYYPLSILTIFVLLNKNKLIYPAISLSFILFLTISNYFDHNHIGYADIPVMTLTSISVTILLVSSICKDNNYKKYIVISIFFAACASVIKQAGLLLFLFIPLISYELGLLCKYKRKFWMYYFIAFLMISAPWYIYIRYNIHYNNFPSEIDIVTTHIHQGRSYFQRLILAIQNYPFPFYLALLSLPAFFSKKYKFITFSGIFSYLIWCLFFSYSIRNIAVAIPFLGLATGVAIPIYINMIGKIIYNLFSYLFNLINYSINQVNFFYKKLNLFCFFCKNTYFYYKIIVIYKKLYKYFNFKRIIYLFFILVIISTFYLDNKVNMLLSSRQNNLNINKCNNIFLNSILLYTSKLNDDIFYGNYSSLCVPFLTNYYQIQYDNYIDNIPEHTHYFLLINNHSSKFCPNEISTYRKCSVLLSENGFNLLHIE